ncbi:hypothetical protein SBV1_650019 [Verrucomicrobia bacterium]|nr:hypothetical protein SBV1_650019 [Verrucomicrobiota bacterium]
MAKIRGFAGGGYGDYILTGGVAAVPRIYEAGGTESWAGTETRIRITRGRRMEIWTWAGNR